MNKKLAGFLKVLSRIGFILCFGMAVFTFGETYGRFSEPGQDFISFVSTDQHYEYNQFEGPPQVLVDQVNAYNRIHHYIYYAVLCSFLVMFFDYFIDPKNHFFTTLKNKLKGIKLEEDL